MNIRFEKSLWKDLYYVVVAFPLGVELCAINDAMFVRKLGTPSRKPVYEHHRVCTFYPWSRGYGINPYGFIV